ncbi:MAG: hypothetical protein FWE98_01945 [Oscillospiraceae bacterium]|nr:hypothetical protein [Oscillospiraceae bacterium]
MEKTTWRKVLAAGWIIAASLPIYSLILPPSGTEWIHDWMRFALFMCAPIYMLVYMLVPQTAKKKKKESAEEPKEEQAANPRKPSILMAILVLTAVIVAASSLLGFVVTLPRHQKVDRYLKSPGGKNRAVVMNEWGSEEYIYPVKSFLFYKNHEGICIIPRVYDVTLTWLDDNTLEINRTYKTSGEVSTDYLRW